MTYGGRIEAYMAVPAATFNATSGGVGPTLITLTAASRTPTELAGHIQAQLIAAKGAGWTCSISTGPTGTGQVFIRYIGSVYSIAWVSTELRDILGFTVDLVAVGSGVTSTSAKACRGLLLPDCPLGIDGDPKRAPKGSDRRSVVSPTGAVTTHVGSTFYRHRNLRYTHVPRARVWEAEAAIANSSYEYWFNETQLGLGSSWFTATSRVKIYFSNGGTDTLVGIDGNSGTGLTGWFVPDAKQLDELELAVPEWVGYVRIDLGDITSDG